MIIEPRQQKLPETIQLKIRNVELQESDCVKYLGVLIDNNLTWKKHIAHVNNKIAKSIGLLAKLRHHALKSILCNTYNAFISRHVNYSLINWGGACFYPTTSV